MSAGRQTLVSVVRRERLAARGQVVRARRGALRAGQGGGRGGRAPAAPRGPRGPAGALASLAQHVARFPHGRSYNNQTPNSL